MRIVRIFIVKKMSSQPDPRDATPQTAPTPTPERVVESQDLLQGRNSVTITHRGVPYRLQETRAGKLILTK
jgi:hemin uptake protein HemP